VVMAEFIAGGHFQRHIRRMRIAARSRRDALLRDWPASIPGCAAMPSVDAGLHLCVRVDSLQREAQLVAAATAVGVEISPLSGYWLAQDSPPSNQRAGLVLGFAAVPEGQVAAALALLRQAWGV
jgi:GntR family transcriptional regulator/MocR family aminotransferase